MAFIPFSFYYTEENNLHDFFQLYLSAAVITCVMEKIPGTKKKGTDSDSEARNLHEKYNCLLLFLVSFQLRNLMSFLGLCV